MVASPTSMQGKAVSYIPRPTLDLAIARSLNSGAGAYALEGPGGAGKSAALLHGLMTERERRGKGGRGHVRILQLWGDEPPSLFVQRLLREVGLLNLVAYPKPEQLGKLVAEMAQAIPGLGAAGKVAGKVLGSMFSDDLRPLPSLAAQALGEAGQRAMAAGEASGPLCIGVDLQGGEVSAPVRDFFARLVEQLPPTVVLLFAQPGGASFLAQVPAGQRIAVGPFTPDEARAFLEERLGALDGDTEELLSAKRLSLLPGDLAQIVNLYTYLGSSGVKEKGLRAVLPYLERDLAERYRMIYESQLLQPGADARVLELCAVCAVTARPQQPLSLELALERMRNTPPLRPSELGQVRQAPLVRALCEGLGGTTSWPLEPLSAQARDGVLLALRRNGLLDVYEKRWLDELLERLRGTPKDSIGPSASGLLAGVQALSLLIERTAHDKLALGQAVTLLAEMETLLWRAGWHRTFAELYDALLPHLLTAGVVPRDVAPRLWFRRARTRIQNIDWSVSEAPAGEELEQAIAELSQLEQLTETAVVLARTAIGLFTDGNVVSAWCRHLPFKARQARGYANVLALLLAEHATFSEPAEARHRAAVDDILAALAHFIAADEKEDVAQTLTILGDAYSARQGSKSDALALHQYAQAITVAEQMSPLPTFSLGIIHRSIGNHHHRRGRREQAAQSYASARRYLLRSPDARIGTLLAGLLPA